MVIHYNVGNYSNQCDKINMVSRTRPKVCRRGGEEK
jgi:hypothetical protein